MGGVGGARKPQPSPNTSRPSTIEDTSTSMPSTANNNEWYFVSDVYLSIVVMIWNNIFANSLLANFLMENEPWYGHIGSILVRTWLILEKAHSQSPKTNNQELIANNVTESVFDKDKILEDTVRIWNFLIYECGKSSSLNKRLENVKNKI